MILYTLLTRPYVFVFLVAFLVIGALNRGVGKTLFFLLSGYLIAWASEASSIRTGFPYGWYFYRYENLRGEWLNFGVPVWDSLSYTFLCFAGMSVAEYILLPYKFPSPFGERVRVRGGVYQDERVFSPPHPGLLPKREKGLIRMALLSALFVTILDIIVDPLAHRGSEWFLGAIYYYPSPGFYFGVPLSNFAGWFLVSFVIVLVNVWFEKRVTLNKVGAGLKSAPTPATWIARYGGIGLYFGVFVFNFLMTLWIQAWLLSGMALLWISFPLFSLIQSRKTLKTLKPS